MPVRICEVLCCKLFCLLMAVALKKTKYKLAEGSAGYPKKTGATSSVGTMNARNPIHHAPTQRGSFCCSAILQCKSSTDVHCCTIYVSLLHATNKETKTPTRKKHNRNMVGLKKRPVYSTSYRDPKFMSSSLGSPLRPASLNRNIPLILTPTISLTGIHTPYCNTDALTLTDKANNCPLLRSLQPVSTECKQGYILCLRNRGYQL